MHVYFGAIEFNGKIAASIQIVGDNNYVTTCLCQQNVRIYLTRKIIFEVKIKKMLHGTHSGLQSTFPAAN